MKNINEVFSDEEAALLEYLKGDKTWKELILDMADVYHEHKKGKRKDLERRYKEWRYNKGDTS